MLKVNRESIRLPEIQLPPIDSPEVSQSSELAKTGRSAIAPENETALGIAPTKNYFVCVQL